MNRNEKGFSDGAIVFGVVALIIFLPLAIWAFSVWAAPMFGQGNAYKKTESSDYRIANYEKFKTDCNAIVAQEQKIILAQQALDNETVGKVDSPREFQLQTNVQALMNVRADQISSYNAAADMNTTKAKFKDAGLPDEIPINGEIGAVTCPAE